MSPQDKIRFSIPASLEEFILKNLKAEFAVNVSDSKYIAECIQKSSDFFIKNPDAPTAWQEKWMQVAYFAYYLPLNYLRNLKVLNEAKNRNFFADINHGIDWGAGLGSWSWVLKLNSQLVSPNEPQQTITISAIEKSLNVQKWYETAHGKKPKSNLHELEKNFSHKKSILAMSYAYTELKEWPRVFNSFEALWIVEPSTRQDGRRLLELRQQLMDAGYFIYAPCTHQTPCPLLTESQKDWCHDRMHVNMPVWFQNIENFLPFKNTTLTFSYLLARKTATTEKFSANTARLVGDTLVEKGKTRQLICRGEKREFLSWLHKDLKWDGQPRGELLQIPEDSALRANEVRISKIP